MQFLTHLEKSDGWRHDILATDISTRALDVARAGDWPAERVMEIPQRYARRFIVTENRDRNPHIRATRELRDAIRFDRFNLNDSNSNVSGSFDLIFCRNVLIYFSAEGRKAVIDRLIAKLAPGGLLFVGHAESLHQHRDRLRPLLPTVYTHVA
jgi:chemotaxis protein methyltransferase CheR